MHTNTKGGKYDRYSKTYKRKPGIAPYIDSATLLPEPFSWDLSVSTKDMIRLARYVNKIVKTDPAEKIEELKQANDWLRKGAFAALAVVYRSTGAMTAVHFKSISEDIETCQDASRLMEIYINACAISDEVWSGETNEEYIEKVTDMLVDQIKPSKKIKKKLKSITESVTDEQITQMRRQTCDEAVKVFVKKFADSNREYRIHVPASYKEAMSISGCSEKVARYTACICEAPEIMYNYYIDSKLARRVERMDTFTKAFSFEADPEHPYVKNEIKLISEARIIMTLCNAVLQVSEKPALTATEIAGILNRVYNEPDGDISHETESILRELQAQGYSDGLPVDILK